MKATGRATVRVPGTCGELVQGARDGLPFLVSCPVDLFSTVTVELGEGGGGITAPPDAPKAAAALQKALVFFGQPDLGARLTISSPLPRSKGMGSSTADVAGAIYAAAIALGRSIDPRQVAALAVALEPTDSSLFPNLALFDHRGGRVYEVLGPPLSLDIVVLDLGGEVDTIAFNACYRSALLRRLEPQASEALRLVRAGVAQSDPELVGRGATLSARANQLVLYKPQLEAVLALAREMGAAGVCVAHSGTAIGILVDRRGHKGAQVLAAAQAELEGLEAALLCRLVGGGYRLC